MADPDRAPRAASRRHQGAGARRLADEHVDITILNPSAPAPPSSLEPELMAAMERVVPSLWPGVAVVPTLETGGTDGFHLRPAGIPTFGVSGVFIDMDDVRAHGKDERVLVESFHQGVEFYDRLVKLLSSGDQAFRVPR